VTILFTEGFENYNAVEDMAGMWAETGVNAFQQPGRDPSGSSIALSTTTNSIDRAIVNSVSGVIGFAFKFTSTPVAEDYFLDLREASIGRHMSMWLTTSHQLQVRLGLTAPNILQTSSRTLAANVWHYLEVKWLIDDTTGSVEVFVNNKKGGWIDFSGDTQQGGNAYLDSLMLRSGNNLSGQPFNFDDVYILDLLGGAPGNDRLGDSIVETLNPSGVGAEAQWLPSAGSNFQNVDEATPDGDTTFNSSAVVDDDDRFAMDNLVNVPSTVFAVQVQGAFRLENSGNRDVRLKVTDGVTEGQSDDKQPSFDPAYVMQSFMFEDHPTGAAPWSTAEVNAMEAGYRIQA
jgi:hypothetical protein